MAAKRASEGKPRARKKRRRKTHSIEFEDRSGDEYQEIVQEVIAAMDWIQRQRERGNLPN